MFAILAHSPIEEVAEAAIYFILGVAVTLGVFATKKSKTPSES